MSRWGKREDREEALRKDDHLYFPTTNNYVWWGKLLLPLFSHTHVQVFPVRSVRWPNTTMDDWRSPQVGPIFISLLPFLPPFDFSLCLSQSSGHGQVLFVIEVSLQHSKIFTATLRTTGGHLAQLQLYCNVQLRLTGYWNAFTVNTKSETRRDRQRKC